jgi:hypothetical protein
MDSTSKIVYLLDASSITTGASAAEKSFAGMGKAAQSAGVAGAAGLAPLEVAAVKGQTAAQALAAALAQEVPAAVSAATANEQLAVSALAAARAEQAAALAATESGVAHELSAQHAIRLAGAFSHVTEVAIPNVRALGHIAGGLSSVAFGQLAVIAGIAIFTGVLIKLFEEKEKQVEIDKEQIALDLQRHASLHTGTLFTQEYARVLHDVNAVNAQLKHSGEQLAVAQANETDAVRGSTTAYKDVAAATDNVADKIAIYVLGLVKGVQGETEATAARLEASKTLNEQIAARIRLAAEMHQTAEALIAERIAAGATTEEIERLTGAMNRGALAQANFRLGQGIIGDVRFAVASDAAAAGEVLTHAEAQRRFTAELKARGEETVRLAGQTKLIQQNEKAFNDETVRGAKSVAGYANALVDLRKRAAEAEAALSLDTLSLQRFKISAQIQAEREHLAINKRDKVAALQFLDQIERDMLAGTLLAAAEANKQAQEAARAQRLRHLKEIERMERDHNKILFQEYMNLLQHEQKADETAAAARLRQQNAEAERGRAEIAAKAAIQEKYLTGQLFEENKQLAIMDARLRSMEAFAKGDFFGGLSASLGEVLNGFTLAEVGAQSFADAIQAAFTESIVNGQNFAEVFWKTILAGFLKGVGAQAIASGTFHILQGIAKLWDPFTAAQGAQEIAAGAALVAFGSALTATAGLLTASLNHQAAAASAGGAAATSGASAGAARQGVPPQLISFPTSPQTIGPMTIKLDGNQWERLMKGEAVLTMPGIQGKDNRAVKRALKLR